LRSAAFESADQFELSSGADERGIVGVA